MTYTFPTIIGVAVYKLIMSEPSLFKKENWEGIQYAEH